MASKNENHTSRQALKEENETKNVKYKPLPCEYDIGVTTALLHKILSRQTISK